MAPASVFAVEPAAAIDPVDVRADFPILSRQIYGRRLVYLDSAATSQKPRAVLRALQDYYETSNANVHRGVYLLAEEATEAYESARARVARFVGAGSTEEVVFTRNATEAINLVAFCWGHEHVGSGDTVVISAAEHHSNFVPWQRLAGERDSRLQFIDLNSDGTLDLGSFEGILTASTVKLVAVAAVSNVLGSINPVHEIVRLAHRAGALVLVDAAQMAPHMPLDVGAMGADFVAFTGHKMLGPTGIGVLWAKADLLEAMPPFLSGGEMIRRVTESGSTWNDLPWKFEAGTPNIAGAVGLGAAIDYLEHLSMEAVRRHEVGLVEYTLERLGLIDGVTILGPRDPSIRGGVVAFTVDEVHPHDLASILDREGVCVRAGHHCAQPLHEHLGIGASARASFYVYNDHDDVDALCRGVDKAKRVMRAGGTGHAQS